MDSRHAPAKRPKPKRAFRQLEKKAGAVRRQPRKEGAIGSVKPNGNNASARIEEGSTRTAASGKSGAISSSLEADLQARIRELIKLAKEQGYLTFDDLNEALPEGITEADDLDAILTRLRRMEIDIIEASEVDRFKDGKKEAEEEEEEKPEAKLDILDDPVRMYLKQMGQVPLLTANRRWKFPNGSKKPKAWCKSRSTVSASSLVPTWIWPRS